MVEVLFFLVFKRQALRHTGLKINSPKLEKMLKLFYVSIEGNSYNERLGETESMD